MANFRPLLLSLARGLCRVEFNDRPALTADGTPQLTPSADRGLFVWRDADGTWNMQLTAGGTDLKFDGVLTSTKPIDWVNRDLLNSNDSADKTDANTLSMDFQVWNIGYDAVTLSLPAGAGLCLDGSLGTGSLVFLGESTKAVSMPVDLTDSGACGNSVPSAGGTSTQTT